MEELDSSYETEPSPEKLSLLNRLDLNGSKISLHLALFVLTFLSVSLAGLNFFFTLGDAFLFATLLLAFLTAHEFGHYFAAVIHKISTTLPFFIPLPILSPIGTMGAVIRIKERIQTTKQLYDVGVAGPIAGFIVALVILLIGFGTLPGIDYVKSFEGHDDLKAYISTYGEFPDTPFDSEEEGVLMLGNTLLYSFLAQFFDHVPPMWEMYHYPFLFAGWLGLFFTALNLMPIGQLDGGHILYSLLGFKNHRIIARLFFGLITIFAGIGLIPILSEWLESFYSHSSIFVFGVWGILLFFILQKGFRNHTNWIIITGSISLIVTFLMIHFFDARNWSGYTSWGIWIIFIVLIVKIEHPPVIYEQVLDSKRRILGWFSMLLFVLCISPNPMYFLTN